MPTNDGASTPLPRIEERELGRVIKSGFQAVPQQEDASKEKQRNLDRATEELGTIEALSGSSAFNWFFTAAIESGFQGSRTTLEEPGQSAEKLVTSNAEFNVWRKIAQWLDKREFEHRRLLNPSDPKLARLKERLDLH